LISHHSHVSHVMSLPHNEGQFSNKQLLFALSKPRQWSAQRTCLWTNYV